MTRRGALYLGLCFVGLAWTGRVASATITVDPDISLQGEQYAPDLEPSSRIDVNIGARTTDADLLDAPALPRDEFHFYSFFESGPLGDRSIDVDATAARIRLGDSAHLWIGRSQPLSEGWSAPTIRSTDAIGANWVQDQSDALTPRVSGWIGPGVHYRDAGTGLSVTAAYSPIFLPSFGPRLDLSPTSQASGSRFSRLPPQYALVNGNLYPLYYNLDTGNMWNIVRQDQAFAAIGREGPGIDAHAMFWTAPDPNVQPEIDPNHPAVINGGNVDVPVTVYPTFPRQHFWGMQTTVTALAFKPTLMGVYQAENRSFTFSAEAEPFSFLSVGYLNAFGGNNVGAPGGTGVVTPVYADQLVWFEARTTLLRETVTPSLRWEQSLADGNRGYWVCPRVDYRMESNWSLFAYASLLDGESYSYFGTWRSLDSVGMGATWTW